MSSINMLRESLIANPATEIVLCFSIIVLVLSGIKFSKIALDFVWKKLNFNEKEDLTRKVMKIELFIVAFVLVSVFSMMSFASAYFIYEGVREERVKITKEKTINTNNSATQTYNNSNW